jgi:hypothetical protein
MATAVFSTVLFGTWYFVGKRVEKKQPRLV